MAEHANLLPSHENHWRRLRYVLLLRVSVAPANGAVRKSSGQANAIGAGDTGSPGGGNHPPASAPTGIEARVSKTKQSRPSIGGYRFGGRSAVHILRRHQKSR